MTRSSVVNPAREDASAPKRLLSPADAVAVIVGVVIGAGIFRTPPLVAAEAGSVWLFLTLWLAGGVVSVVGALCYAELAATYPNTGGEYHFLHRAFGPSPAFLFAWARLSVIQTGSIALQAFVIGDYAAELLPVGAHSSAIYAATTILLFTGLNVMGLRPGKWTQRILSAGIVLALLAVVIGGLVFMIMRGGSDSAVPGPAVAASAAGGGAGGAVGMAMVFVLLTYGGWNEAAYLSAEIRGERRRIVGVFLWGIGIVAAVYLLVNLAFIAGLGLAGVAGSKTVAADFMSRTVGPTSARLISIVIILAVLSTVNATIFTGARTSYALGRDFPLFGPLGRWNGGADCPATALLVQGGIALGLVLLGSATRTGFETMVDYTAPVFWFFFLLVGVSLIVLRHRDAGHPRPFRVPLYPFTPLLFCAACVYMLQSSLAYTGIGALVGVAVLLAGMPLLLLARNGSPRPLGQRA